MTQLAKLAKAAGEHYVKEGTYLDLPSPLSSDLQLQQACYVLIFEDPGQRLRSMYGQPLPYQRCLAAEIIVNTVYAIHESVRRSDLPYLSYRVAVLGALQRVSQAAHLNPVHYGLYVRSDKGKTALVLPQRLGIETGDDQIATALREASINPRQEEATLYRVAVNYYE